MNATLGSIPPPFTPYPPPSCPVCAACQCSCPTCNNTIVYETFNITNSRIDPIPYNLSCPPPDLHGLSCVPWDTPQKLAVGIVGGVLAGILASVLLSYSLLKRQYKLKKISEFMKEENNI